jgi:glycosyltransferase involved in cell wall biosynthesis
MHCHKTHEAPDVCRVARGLNIKSVFTRHMVEPFKTSKIKCFDAAIAVNPLATEYLKQENIDKKLEVSAIAWIPPFHHAQKFLSYVPTETREEFFGKNFGINLKGMSVACMIANFYDNFDHKNHPLLFKTVAKLVHEKRKPINIMLAGNLNGAMKNIVTTMVNDLGINDYVHFLGYTQQIPGLLHHSDMMVMSSKIETFAVVYFETGIMKRPAIGATQTCAEFILVNEKTGLLFENNNVDDFAQKIECLIDNPEFAHQLGLNAYEHIKKNFSPESIFAQHAALYAKLASPYQQ